MHESKTGESTLNCDFLRFWSLLNLMAVSSFDISPSRKFLADPDKSEKATRSQTATFA